MKTLVTVNEEKDLSLASDGFILFLKDMSLGGSLEFTTDEVLKLKELYKDKEIFLKINKNFFNSDLENLEKILYKLNGSKIKIMFADLSFLYFQDKYDLDLVWNQDFLVTNYHDINNYYDLGVKYAVITNELDLNEIKEIIKNSKSKLLMNVLAKPIIGVSKRPLISLYSDTLPKTITLKNKDKEIIMEEKKETIVYSNNFFNYLDLLDTNIDYFILDTKFINYKDKEEVINNMYSYLKTKDNKYKDKIALKFGDNTMYLYNAPRDTVK